MFKIANPAGAAIRYIYSAFAAASARKALRPLLSVDERLLCDIGLTRADVVDCLSSRPGDEPTDLLITRRRERAAARVTFIDHPARWRGSEPQTSPPSRIDRKAA